MTVRELIAELEGLNGDMEVCIAPEFPGYAPLYDQDIDFIHHCPGGDHCDDYDSPDGHVTFFGKYDASNDPGIIINKSKKNKPKNLQPKTKDLIRIMKKETMKK